MNKLALATALVATLALSACDRTPEPAAPVPTAADPAPAAARADAPADAATPSAGRPLPGPLAEGVVFTFPYHFRTRRVDGTAADGFREEFSVEFLDGDVRRTGTKLIGDMRRAGFAVNQDTTSDDGRRLLVFGKKGFGRVRARLVPVDGRKMSHPDARGTVTMVWPHAGPATVTAPTAN